MNRLDLLPWFVKPILFAVDAAAVGLAIHREIAGCFNPFLPPRTKIFIKKRHTGGFADRFTDGFDHVVFLKFAVKQRRREIIEFTPLGQQGRGSQSIVITVAAAILLPVNDVLNKAFQVVAFLVDNPQIDLLGIGLYSFLAFQAFGVGMDVVAVKKAHDFQIAGSHGLDRVNRAGSAAQVQ